MREWSTVPLQWGHLFRWWVGPQHPGKQGDFSCLQSTLQWMQRGSRNSAPVRVVSSSGAVPSLHWRKHPGPLEAMGQSAEGGCYLPELVFCFTWGRVEWEWWWPHLWGRQSNCVVSGRMNWRFVWSSWRLQRQEAELQNAKKKGQQKTTLEWMWVDTPKRGMDGNLCFLAARKRLLSLHIWICRIGTLD